MSPGCGVSEQGSGTIWEDEGQACSAGSHGHRQDSGCAGWARVMLGLGSGRAPPLTATRLGAELPSFSVHMCDTTWPLLWSPGRLCHMHILMCAPGTLQWPGSKLSAPLSPAWPITVTWPAGLWHSAPTAQAPQSPAQASETPVDFPPSLGSFPHRLGTTQPGPCSRGNGGVLSKPCGLHTEDS